MFILMNLMDFFAHYFKRIYENNGQLIYVIKANTSQFFEHEQFTFDVRRREIYYRRGK